MQCSIDLPEDQVRELEQLAAREHRTLGEVVRVAVIDYLTRRRTSADWGHRWEALVADIQAHMPEVTPDEVERDITAAFEEVRAERAAARGKHRRVDAGGS